MVTGASGIRDDLTPVDPHLGQALDGLRDAPGEEAAVHGEGAARGHLDLVRHPHHQRAQAPHLFLEQARGLVEAVAAQAVGADELGEVPGLVHGGRPHRAHLVQVDADPAARELPRGLASGEASAHDGHALAHLASIAFTTKAQRHKGRRNERKGGPERQGSPEAPWPGRELPARS